MQKEIKDMLLYIRKSSNVYFTWEQWIWELLDNDFD